MGTPTLPSAQLRFTSEFGMDSGGTTALLSLNKKGTILKADVHRCTNVAMIRISRRDGYKYRLVFLIQVTRKYVMFSTFSFHLGSSVSLHTIHFIVQNYLGVVWLSLTGN